MSAKYNSTIPKYFNQLVETRRVEEFNEAFVALEEFATANGFAKPKKGQFASDVLDAGIKAITPEEYFKKRV